MCVWQSPKITGPAVGPFTLGDCHHRTLLASLVTMVNDTHRKKWHYKALIWIRGNLSRKTICLETVHYCHSTNYPKLNPLYVLKMQQQCAWKLWRFNTMVSTLVQQLQFLYFTTLYFKTILDYKTAWFGPKGQFSVLNYLYFKSTCNTRPHFVGPMGGLKIEGLLYSLQ